MNIRLRQSVVMMLRRRGKLAFLHQLPQGASVLDVGCGNNSPRDAKVLRPDIHYTGLDIGDYNQQPGALDFADAYVLVSPADFAAAIGRYEGCMDAVVSSHNLEHCNEPETVLDAMVRALRPGGRLYLAVPCEASVGFPHRWGTLNFHDDSTHNHVPRWTTVTQTLLASGCRLDFQRSRYRPLLLALLGLVVEPISALLRRNMPLGVTWALYGFESVIWASRADGENPRTP